MTLAARWMLRALIAVVLPATANAMQNEPADFLGIEWGASLETHRSTLRAITETGDSGYFRRLSDRPFFAGIEVRRISYHFHKGSFVSGAYVSVGTNELKSILAHLTARHGEPARANNRHKIYEWEGDRRGITVSCDISISCHTEFYDKTLREQELAEQSNAQ
ncbi:MAG: hypothetical protein ACKVP2_14250, partial [Burkholderiales bacterium]